MRIIDKNTDFYDYLQGLYRDDSIVFNRADSFLVTKEIMCSAIYAERARFYYRNRPRHHFVLLQVCNTFWLFLLEVTKFDESAGWSDMPADYTVKLLHSWKNYRKLRERLRLDIISLPYDIRSRWHVFTKNGVTTETEGIINHVKDIVQAVDTNNYTVVKTINHAVVYVGNTRLEKHIPLLKACGLGTLIDPLEIYMALDEYFSLEKTASERTESVDITDKEKIENHGFDTKISFRGKNK